MIDAALKIIADALQHGLQPGSTVSDRLVVVSNLSDASGAAVENSVDRVVIFLVNIQSENVLQRAPSSEDNNRDRLAVRQAPVHLSLQVMIAANFGGSKYNEALKHIGNTIAFFYGTPLFDQVNTPGMEPSIDRLTIEIENMSTTDLSNLWGVFGGRYVPSVLYRLRLLSL